MAEEKRMVAFHPQGEDQIVKPRAATRAVDTYGGKVHLRWDAEAAYS